MDARWVLGLILCLGLVGCGGTSPSAIPTHQAAITTASPSAVSQTPAATSGSPTPTLKATPKPTQQTAIPVPPKPTGVKFDEQRRVGTDASSTKMTQTISWEAPRNADVEIKVYGVTECTARPKDPAPNTTGPCLVTGTPLPASVRTLLATAPASEGAVSWTWTGEFECGEFDPAYDPRGPAYHAVVLAANNASGHSIFEIAAPGGWWEPGPDEIVC